MIPDPFLHGDSGSVRFWVMVDGQAIGASIRQETLHHRFAAGRSGTHGTAYEKNETPFTW